MEARDGTDGEPASSAGAAGTVVHLLASHDAVLVRRIASLSRAQLARGVPQSVVLLDDEGLHPLLTRFDAAVHLVLVGSRPMRDLPQRLLEALHHELRRAPAATVHAHGWLACALAKIAASLGDIGVPVRCSGLPRLGGTFTAAGEAGALAPGGSAWTLAAAARTAFELPQALFDAARREALPPLVATSSAGGDARHAARFAQLAVLLGSTSDRLVFRWIGPADATSTAQLNAAGVALHDAPSALRRAGRLRPAWIYAALGSGPQAAHGLAEAMAMGLACIAWDSVAHRAFIEHGRTGLLCNSDDALLEGVAALVDSGDLRARLGAAARDTACRHFRHLPGSRSVQVAEEAAATPAASFPLPLDF